MNNGVPNNNNKSNNNNVVPFFEFQLIAMLMEYPRKENEYVSLEEVVAGFYECRRKKFSKNSCVSYNIDYECNLVDLHKELNSMTYKIGTSIAFVVTRPKCREIFAADFRDRIVQHILMRRLEPIIERKFINDTYNCRKGRGTLFGIKRMREMIWQQSEGYTKKCYYLKFDIKSFFLSISKTILWNKLKKLLENNYSGKDLQWMMWLTHKVVMHRPELCCEKHGDLNLWQYIDDDKSLFTSPLDKGLAIGNLSSQIFANFYLNDFDHWMQNTVPAYGRYVDDGVVISRNKAFLKWLVPQIKQRLSEIGVTLHPRKVMIQDVRKGLVFTGACIKPYRMYVGKQVSYNAYDAMKMAGSAHRNNVEKFTATANSYLGTMKHYRSMCQKSKMIMNIKGGWFKYIRLTQNINTVCIRPHYKQKNILRHRVRRIIKNKSKYGSWIF